MSATSSAYYRVFPGGTRPDNVTNLIDALTALLTTSSEQTKVQTRSFTDDRRVIVPVNPELDREQALAMLHSRIHHDIPTNVDIILQTSGSTTGQGHFVGLTSSAVKASAKATLSDLYGPGRWILALPVHHIAGFQILVRSILAETRPLIVDTTKGFRPDALTRAIERGILQEEKRRRRLFEASGLDFDTDRDKVADDQNLQRKPLYLSLVPTQLHKILDDEDAALALSKVDAVLLGGANSSPSLLAAAKRHSINVVTTYGMTETCGGCVYNGMPVAGMQVAAINNRIWLSGTALMETYVDAPDKADFIIQGHRRWLRTNDSGHMDGPRLVVDGRIDDVITTGGVKIQASLVEQTITDMPEVDQCCVVGVPEVRWGELVTAVCVPSEQADEKIVAPLRALCLPDQEAPEEKPDVSKPLEYQTRPVPKAKLTPLEAAMAAMAAKIRGEDVDVVEAAKTGELPYNIYQVGRSDDDDVDAATNEDAEAATDVSESSSEVDSTDLEKDSTADISEDPAQTDDESTKSTTDLQDDDPACVEANESTFAVMIRGRVSRDLDRAHAPRAIIIMDSLPMLASGKPDRHEIERLATAAVHQQRAWLR
ncbi:MAG: AMP-binding protein [Actinomycetaceae bacterium]|nr:AMP-binding protein [Actinomycetaceae bacterium]